MAEDGAGKAILKVLAEHQEVTGPMLRDLAAVGTDAFYPAITALEAAGKVKSRWAEGDGPEIRLTASVVSGSPRTHEPVGPSEAAVAERSAIHPEPRSTLNLHRPPHAVHFTRGWSSRGWRSVSVRLWPIPAGQGSAGANALRLQASHQATIRAWVWMSARRLKALTGLHPAVPARSSAAVIPSAGMRGG